MNRDGEDMMGDEAVGRGADKVSAGPSESSMHESKQSGRQQVTEEVAQAYVAFGDAIRLAILPTWITADLTISQLKAVFFVAHYDVLTVSELARLLGIGNPGASVLVQQLVEQDVLERTEDAQDRRRALVSLTAAGRKLISGRREQIEAKFRQCLNEVSDAELAGLQRGFEALLEVVRSEQV